MGPLPFFRPPPSFLPLFHRLTHPTLPRARRFAPAEAFLAEDLSQERFSKEVLSSLSARGSWDRACASASRAWAILQHAPCLISFQERAKVFQMLVSNDRQAIRERQVRPPPSSPSSISSPTDPPPCQLVCCAVACAFLPTS